MSRNSYSIRNRGGQQQQQQYEHQDKRQRMDQYGSQMPGLQQQQPMNNGGTFVKTERGQGRDRDNRDTSRVLYVGNIPKDWNEDIMHSVVAGSGRIVDVRVRIDPSGRSKNYTFVEYETAAEAQKGLTLLSQVLLGPSKRLKIEVSREALKENANMRPVLRFNRDHLPFYVTIPPEMLEAVPLSQAQQHQRQHTSSQSPVQPAPQVQQVEVAKPEIPMPDILTKASQFLPAFNASAFSMEDKIAENLQGLNPPQMIQLISTIKSLAKANPMAAQQVFSMSEDIPTATVQALLLMGLVDANVLTSALQLTNPTASAPAHRAPVPSHRAPLPPQQTPLPPQQQYQQHQRTPPSDPRWPGIPPHAAAKLAMLSQQEAATIAQVLQLDPTVIRTLPAEQQQMVNGIRSQYLA